MNWGPLLIIIDGLGLYGAGFLHGWALGRLALLRDSDDRQRRLKGDLDQLAGRVGDIEGNFRPISARPSHGR